MLRSIGYWSIGKSNNGIYFQRRTGQDGVVGFIYSLDGNVPRHVRLHIGRLEPLTQNGWFHFELSLTPEQCIEEAEAALYENFGLFTLVKNYLAQIEYRRIIIVGLLDDMYVSNSGRVSIDNVEVVAAIEALRSNSFSSIARDGHTIRFLRSTRGRDFGNGIVYSIDGNKPELQFLTKLEPLPVKSYST
ncbi:MAG: hypothetical protein FWC66_08050 [Oscillospiraceae bacterium]|nr:hypothetical protein [Oscillospiraceae bacterium]